MITMKVGSGAKAPVRFIFSDKVSETTVTLYQDDPPEVVRAKLQRVLELEGAALPVAPPAQPAAPAEPTFTPADRAATEERLKGAQADGVGWSENADYEKLPEM